MFANDGSQLSARRIRLDLVSGVVRYVEPIPIHGVGCVPAELTRILCDDSVTAGTGGTRRADVELNAGKRAEFPGGLAVCRVAEHIFLRPLDARRTATSEHPETPLHREGPVLEHPDRRGIDHAWTRLEGYGAGEPAFRVKHRGPPPHDIEGDQRVASESPQPTKHLEFTGAFA